MANRIIIPCRKKSRSEKVIFIFCLPKENVKNRLNIEGFLHVKLSNEKTLRWVDSTLETR